MGILPEVLADLTGPLGDLSEEGEALNRASLLSWVAALGRFETHVGVSKEEIAGIVPESRLEWGLGAGGGGRAPSPPRGRHSGCSWRCHRELSDIPT